jgi:hypothetical protein
MRTVVRVPLLLLLLSVARPAAAQGWDWPAPGNAPAVFSRRLAELDPATIESFATAALLRNVLEHLARTRGVLDEPQREYIRTALGCARTTCEPVRRG